MGALLALLVYFHFIPYLPGIVNLVESKLPGHFGLGLVPGEHLGLGSFGIGLCPFLNLCLPGQMTGVVNGQDLYDLLFRKKVDRKINELDNRYRVDF